MVISGFFLNVFCFLFTDSFSTEPFRNPEVISNYMIMLIKGIHTHKTQKTPETGLNKSASKRGDSGSF